MIDDFCSFFKDIEADPKRLIKGMTVRDMYLAKAHLLECSECRDISERILSKYDSQEPPIEFGAN